MIKLLKKSDAGLFASQTLTGHLVRGSAAFTLLYFAIDQQQAHPAWAVAAGIAALFAMRGALSAGRSVWSKPFNSDLRDSVARQSPDQGMHIDFVRRACG